MADQKTIRSIRQHKARDLPELNELYNLLYSKYGPQGWWPLMRLQKSKQNPTERGKNTWYHPKEYNYPHSEEDIFEIMIGAILTQNTSWENADKALGNLAKHGLLNKKKILECKQDFLAEIIRSSGYYNQKAIKLQNLCTFLQNQPISDLKLIETTKLRKALLQVKGIGPETADSILLYGFNRPVFVIDAYTYRLMLYMGYFAQKPKYDELQTFFHHNLEPNAAVFNEYHALIVQHCVRVCRKQPKCAECPFQEICHQKAAIFIKPRKKKNRKREN
ncbi:endonuclease III domain-containing protein [Candidatus Harpocratesius sp.]